MPKAGLNGFDWTFLQTSTFVLRLNFSGQNNSEKAVYLEYNGDKNGNNIPDANEIGTIPLEEDGDFRSQESISLLTQADIIVTSPFNGCFKN